MEEHPLLDEVMRSLGAAWRALRLYPSNSPLAGQAVERACNAIEEFLQAEPSLKLDIVRGGFVLRGLDEVLDGPGVPELSTTIGEHGIGELHFVAPPSPEEMLALLSATHVRPLELQEAGGMQTALNRANVGSIKVVALVLSKIETPPEIPEDEADKFLAELAADADRLAVWLRSLLASDDEGLAEGIRTLASAAQSVKVFGRTMAAAFLELDTVDTDRLLEASITLESIRDVTEEMLANLSALELTAAIRGGRYGENLMAISFALTALPIRDRSSELLAEIEQALRAADMSEEELRFLEEMIRVRQAAGPEPDLAQIHPEYESVRLATCLDVEQIASVHHAVASRQRLDAECIEVVVHLLDAAVDFPAYCRALEALARTVPHLLEVGEPDHAMHVVREVSSRSESSDKPWPGLLDKFSEAMQQACGTRSMAALLEMSDTFESATDNAKEFVAFGGDDAAQGLGTAAMESEAEDSMDFAEAVLGRRLPEILSTRVAGLEARHVAKIAELFARDGSPQSMHALAELIARPEDKVRSKTARGIVAGGGQALTALMPRLLRDPSQTVALVAATALAQDGGPAGVGLLSARLRELEGDKDLPLAREIIGSLAASSSPAAEAALRETADRGSRFRGGKYAEMKRLAREALESRQGQKG